MRKLIHKRPRGQQSLDLFFKPNKEKLVVKETPEVIESSPQAPNIQNTSENTSYNPIISYSDFEFDFNSGDEDKQLFDEKNNNNRDANYIINSKKKSENVIADNDFDYENEEEESNDFLFNESQVSSPTIVTRHKELEKKNEKVNIFTPSWKFTSSADKSNENHYSNFKYDLNTMCNIHYQLEVIEKRIQNGDDEEHDHPAMCVQVLDDEGISEVTDDERKLRNNYNDMGFDKIKPSFWEPRCYDNEYCQLTPNDNKLLQNAIYLANDTFSDEIATWEPEDDLIPPENDKKLNCFFNKNQNKEKIENYDNTVESSHLPKYVFVNNLSKKAPSISFISSGRKEPMKKSQIGKDGKYKENNNNIKKQSTNTKDQKKSSSLSVKKEHTPKKVINKKDSKKKEPENLFDESDSGYDSESDSECVSVPDTDCSSLPDSEIDTDSGSDSNNLNSINDNKIENNQTVQNTNLIGKPKISKQKLLTLSSLLFDTDSTDGETDLENF